MLVTTLVKKSMKAKERQLMKHMADKLLNLVSSKIMLCVPTKYLILSLINVFDMDYCCLFDIF